MASITKRYGKWQIRVSYKDKDGKYKTANQGGLATKKAAQLLAADWEGKISRGEPLKGEKASHLFSEYFLKWFRDFKLAKVSPRTQNRYMITYRELKKYFKTTKIEKVTRRDYQKFMTTYGKKHARDTVHKVNTLIRACVKNAIYEELIVKDFTDGIELVWDDSRTHRIDYLNMKETQTLTAAILENPSHNFTSRSMILTAILTGMRLGEIQGLQWKDINLNFKAISVNHAWNESTKKQIPTKTASSVRVIRINQQLTNVLKDMQEHKRDEYVFTNQYGTIPTSNAVNQTLRRLLSDLDIARNGFHFHSLRHTHVAYLLAEGVDIYAISKRLGHSDLGTTTRIYSYLIDEYRAKTDNEIEIALDRITSPKDSTVQDRAKKV
ncbi:tyrosine-type recombinase/integrase [Levilactobacillus brevis]|uniref:tyrosine-type recombinase/integrase n=1 Tax=Levilactobacillus brevis TaxID=1580 RepID=UPI000A2FC8B3|nr:site-specific integrase [Levilactobacillus brevis]ARQ92208.1 integrase [Levilactobacillus brevis]